jgi:putative nucleotidyltransferase with HDIG domain
MTRPTPGRPPARVLVVDDEPSFGQFVSEALTELGYQVEYAERPSQGLQKLAQAGFDVAVLDLNLPEMGGIELARRIKANSPDTQLIVLTGHADMESAIAGIQEGVFDYLQKGSIKVARLEKSVREACEKVRLSRENRELLRRLAESNRLLTMLHEMTATLTGERHLDRLLEQVVRDARALLGADVASLLLFHRAGSGDLVVETAVGDGALGLQGVRLSPAQSIAAWVVEQDQAVLLADAATHPAFSPRSDGFAQGLPGFCCAPVRHGTVLGSLAVAGIPLPFPEHKELVGTLARQAAMAIENALYQDRSLNFFTHISEILVSFLEKMDPLYAGHSRGTAAAADMLTRRMGLGDAERRSVHFGALLHDIGKIRLPQDLLSSATPLDERTRALIRQHPTLGMEMLKPIWALREILPIVHAHHERWDGNGYPLGLAGDEIPLGARVVAIAECFDAMARRTPHGQERTPEQALEELERCAGSQFDPQLVRLFAAEFRQRGDPRAVH